jgi:hypothetical protein
MWLFGSSARFLYVNDNVETLFAIPLMEQTRYDGLACFNGLHRLKKSEIQFKNTSGPRPVLNLLSLSKRALVQDAEPYWSDPDPVAVFLS